MKKQILIADGYNIIGNWPELNKLKQNDHLADARDRLLQILSEYRKFREIEVILVFDAMYVPGIKQSYVQYNLEVVFTDEDETADSYIEGLAGKLMSPITQVTVVSSDQAEQWTIFSRGALRVSSHDFIVRFAERAVKLTMMPSIIMIGPCNGICRGIRRN